MSIRILATADLHIGRVSSNSERIGSYGATRETWLRLVEWAAEQQVHAVVLSGDLVEHQNSYFEAEGVLGDGLEILNKSEIPVLMVSGNHDFDVLPALLRNRDFTHVHLLGDKGTWEEKTLAIADRDVQFFGWSFPARRISFDPLTDFPADKINPEIPSIGLLHGDYQARESHYAPLSSTGLAATGVDAWVLGHIHKPQTLRDSKPLIFYPGSPHALNPKEDGPHGPFILTIETETPQVHRKKTYFPVRIHHIPLSPVRYERIEVDISAILQQPTDPADTPEGTGEDTHADENDIKAKVVRACRDAAEKHQETSDHLRLLSLDVILTGRIPNIPQVEQWMEKWDVEELVQRTGSIQTVVRKLEHQCTLLVQNLEALSREPSPAGVLARAILDLENKQPSDFLDSLRAKVKNGIDKLNDQPAFSDIRNSADHELLQPESPSMDRLLLSQCHRLLSELLSSNQNPR